MKKLFVLVQMVCMFVLGIFISMNNVQAEDSYKEIHVQNFYNLPIIIEVQNAVDAPTDGSPINLKGDHIYMVYPDQWIDFKKDYNWNQKINHGTYILNFRFLDSKSGVSVNSIAMFDLGDFIEQGTGKHIGLDDSKGMDFISASDWAKMYPTRPSKQRSK
jgi:hypothetical protein